MLIIAKGLLKSIPVMLIMSACVAFAGRLESIAFGGVLVTLGIILVSLFLAAAVWAYYIPWMRHEFLVSLCPVPLAVLFVVSYFSGFTGPELLNSFNLGWAAQICLALLVPWVGGTLLGSRWRVRKTA